MKILVLALCLFPLSVGFAQNSSAIESILAQKRTEIEKIDLKVLNSVSLVPSTFAQNEVAFNLSIDEVKDLTIIKVYYIYTKYKQSPGFNQLNLDRKRFEQLNASFPELIVDPFVEWEIVEQTGCISPEMGSTFFHGFVFIHRPIQTPEERIAEIERLAAYLKNPTDIYVQAKLDILEEQIKPTVGIASTSAKPYLIPDQEAQFTEGADAMLAYLKRQLRTDEIAVKRDDKWVKTHIYIDKKGNITNLEILEGQPERIQSSVENAIRSMPRWKPAIRDSIPVDSEIDLELRVSYSPSVNGMYLINGHRPNLEPTNMGEKPSDLGELYDGASPEEIFMKQSPVYKGLEVLNRSERTALVMDVTGSMMENVASMKRWINVHQDSLNFTSFTFFNDGDDKPTKKKKIGTTGGIYSTFNIETIDDLVTETMRRGSGGERPESDIEAMLHTQLKDTFCDVILLLGDNYSEVRDLELLPKIKKKVNVLICSAKGAIRTDYLHIAKNTGGNLIYNGEVINVQRIVKGQILSIGSYQYDFDGSQFTLRTTHESRTRMKS